jgi:hypothetical protein
MFIAFCTWVETVFAIFARACNLMSSISSSTAGELNPFLVSLDDDDPTSADERGTVPVGLWANVMAHLSKKSETPAPAPITIVHSATPAAQSCCGCRWILALAAVCVIIGMAIALLVVSLRGSSKELEAIGDEAQSLITRYAALQHHYGIVAQFDMYGDELLASDVRTETESIKSFARITGSVDLATQRFDWNLRVVDAHNTLGGKMTVALWVQRYDTGTHLVKHAAHSPLVLCAGLVASQVCAGHIDRPAAELSASDELDPHILSLAIYNTAQAGAVINRTTEPVWIVTIP